MQQRSACQWGVECVVLIRAVAQHIEVLRTQRLHKEGGGEDSVAVVVCGYKMWGHPFQIGLRELKLGFD